MHVKTAQQPAEMNANRESRDDHVIVAGETGTPGCG